LGARGWDTPADIERDREEYDELDGEYGELAGAGPSRPKGKKRKIQRPVVRDDLSLDTFQRNYTSEDNASFVQIVQEDNEHRRGEVAWAWEAEQKAEQRKLEGEERRKMILDAATSGRWRVDANGKRLIGGLDEGGRDRSEGEAWKEEMKLIAGPSSEGEIAGSGETSTSALVQHSSSTTSGALILASDKRPADSVVETALPEEHPLNKALVAAGLPGTALVSVEDGQIVPRREVVSGGGEGRGRGEIDRAKRDEIEKAVLGNEREEYLPLSGSGGDQWGYKVCLLLNENADEQTRNNFFFPADANTAPYPTGAAPKPIGRSAPPTISHAATRLPDEDEVRPLGLRAGTTSSRRGSSPARSLIDAAVKGTPYRPNTDEGPSIGNYSLVPNDPSPSPQELPSLLTWGALASTPRALDGGDDPLDTSRPSFKLPENKRRDELGRKLGNKASKAINERARAYTPQRASGSSALSAALRSAADRTTRNRGDKTPGKMLPPSTPRADTLTPAARQLLQRSMGLSGRTGLGTAGRNRGAVMEKGQGWSGGIGKADLSKMHWTPSPAHRK